MEIPEYPVAEAWQVFRNVAKDWDAALASGNAPDHDVIERILAATGLVLRAYCLPTNFRDDGTPKEHFPVELAHLIANQIGYIRQGYLPSPIKDMIRPGAPGIGPHERKDIGLAVAYIRAVREGMIEDQHPVKTVAKFYGVTPRGVQRWQQNHPNVEASDFFWGVEDAELGELLAHAMREAGIRYKKAGRGSKGRAEFPRPDKRPRAEQTD